MTRVAVLGDSRAGKTEFMHLATSGRAPLNIYTSREPELFTLQGAFSTALFVVVPGSADGDAFEAAVAGADAILVLYADHHAEAARRWILRVTRGRSTTLPILICAHNAKGPPAPQRVADLLRHFPSAEHTYTSTLYVTGIVDCANRIVRRARKELGSPVSLNTSST